MSGGEAPGDERGPASSRRAGARQPLAEAQVVAAGPATLGELLSSPVGQSGIQQVAGLRRVARRMGIESVRDLLFHLPRRYDDLRELRTLADIRDVEDGTVSSAPAST